MLVLDGGYSTVNIAVDVAANEEALIERRPFLSRFVIGRVSKVFVRSCYRFVFVLQAVRN